MMLSSLVAKRCVPLASFSFAFIFFCHSPFTFPLLSLSPFLLSLSQQQQQLQQVQRELLPSILPAFMIASTPDTEAGLRQGAVYGIGVSASAGGAHFAPYINDAVQVLINCISHPSAFQDGNGKRRRKQFNPINFGSLLFC